MCSCLEKSHPIEHLDPEKEATITCKLPQVVLWKDLVIEECAQVQGSNEIDTTK
jgi:hypothetical protein